MIAPMIAVISVFLGLYVLEWDRSKKRIAAMSRKRKELDQQKNKERLQLEEENKYLRLQLGMPPERREAILPEPKKPEPIKADPPKKTGTGGPVPVTLVMVGAAMALYAAKKKKLPRKREEYSKAELASAYRKIADKADKGRRPIASTTKVKCGYCGAKFNADQTRCHSCGAPAPSSPRQDEVDGQQTFISELYGEMTRLNEYVKPYVESEDR